MSNFRFVLCLNCGKRHKGEKKTCDACGEDHAVQTVFTPEGPYTPQEFCDLLMRRTVRFEKGDKHLILIRLLATVACGFAETS